MKQTAVEWLIEQMKEDQEVKAKSDSEWKKTFDQAKSMEKEQIIHAYYQGDADSDNIEVDAEDYYKVIYKSE